MSERFGAYEIEQEVGRGGMGVVYRARELALDRLVALKLIAEEIAGVPVLRARFERESRLAASIDHPHIVTVHAVGEHEGRAFIAMQWVDGGDLKARLEGGPLPVDDAVRVGAQIADALQAAHDRGLLHRDVKPANVLLRDGPRVHALLADFGIARDQKAEVQLTSTGAYVGTPLYTAPEQIAGGGAEPRSDVYALGCVLHTCLTGALPFGGVGEEARLRWAHLHAERPHVRDARPEVPAALDALVHRCLAVDPRERPTAEELAAALEGLDTSPTPVDEPTAVLPLDQPTVVARTPVAPTRAAVEPPTVVTAAAPPPGGRGRGPLYAVLGLLVAAAIAVGVVLGTGGGDDDRGGGTRTEARTTTDGEPDPTPTPTVGAEPTATPSPAPTPEGATAPSAETLAAVRGVFDTYLEAYDREDVGLMRALLDPEVRRRGVTADERCGETTGRDAVMRDYRYNFGLLNGTYAIQGLDDDSSFVQQPDGAITTKGLTYSIGDGGGTRPIQLTLRDDGTGAGYRVVGVAAC